MMCIDVAMKWPLAALLVLVPACGDDGGSGRGSDDGGGGTDGASGDSGKCGDSGRHLPEGLGDDIASGKLASFGLTPHCSPATLESVAGVVMDPEARDEPRRAVTGTGERDCQGNVRAICDAGWTGPGCDHACDPGALSCGFRHYCHSDGRIAGIALSRAHLFAFSPSIGPLALRDRLEQWVVTHEGDLDMPDGLTPSMLALEPADNFTISHDV